VDEQRSGIVKASVFMNLLNCMDITLDETSLNSMEADCCFNRHDCMQIKFENAINALKFEDGRWTYSDSKARVVKVEPDARKDTMSQVSRLTSENLNRLDVTELKSRVSRRSRLKSALPSKAPTMVTSPD
jgi:hypothetical protein